MAEPVSPLPSQQKNEPIPWPEPALQSSHMQSPVSPLPENATSPDTEDSWDRIQDAASEMLARAAARMRQLRRERPLEIIVAVAAASFALGCALRIWRNHYE